MGSPDHYFYRKSLNGLEKCKIYRHLKSGRNFFLKRFLDTLDGKNHFVEFYEIELFEEEVSDIDSGQLLPIRINKKRVFSETIENFTLNFSRYASSGEPKLIVAETANRLVS